MCRGPTWYDTCLSFSYLVSAVNCMLTIIIIILYFCTQIFKSTSPINLKSYSGEPITMNGVAATTTNSEVSCWICLDEGADDLGNHLTRNCACRGDSGWVHVSCISNFAKVSACDFIVIGNDGLRLDNSVLISGVATLYILYKIYYVVILCMNI